MMKPEYWNLIGLVLNLIGVVLLFRYGMPYQVRRQGRSALLLGKIDVEEMRKECRYDCLGNLGLGLIVVGTACQAWPNWIAR